MTEMKFLKHHNVCQAEPIVEFIVAEFLFYGSILITPSLILEVERQSLCT